MSDVTPEALAAASANLLPLDPPPAEAEIDEVLDRLATAFGADQATRTDARRLLHARFAIRMDMGGTLRAEEEHAPWLDARRGSIDPFYWTRYRELLLRRGWPPLVAATLDRSTDELLDLLGNPAEVFPWQRRGLVMGDVQSGKTASYSALICKAADAGYRMIILLTGTLENVRRQTQERLDEAFIGFDSRDYLVGAQARQKRHVGVGLIDGQRDGVVFTSRDNDFRKTAASALNISLAAINEPVLVVTKKNKGVLERLAGWLRARNQDRDGKVDLPLLMIDDEADNASINTRQSPAETTAINKAIRDLLGLFRRSSYVGFTATPFANIFIDPSSTDDMLGDDLFPRDFIHLLEAPTNYLGMDTLFQPREPEDQSSPGRGTQRTDTVTSITDGEDWLPGSHKKDAAPGALPDSLRTALRCFLLASAIRDIRYRDGGPGRDGGIHRSMLVNVSRFTAVQNGVAEALHLELEEIRRAVRLHGALPPQRAAMESTEIAALAATFEDEFADCGETWTDVLLALHEAIGPVRVQAVNQTTGARSLDYGVTDKPPGVRVVAVGGNSLSRGLTLSGLSTSYFMRNARAYDTLVQMGRWFGYRDGYRDLCRVWMPEETEGWYRHVTEAIAELKRDFGRMRRRRASPREFGLRVRVHPHTLLITARNKMATGINVDEVREISLVGRMIESSRLYCDRRRNEENLDQVDRFVARLLALRGACEESPHGGAVIWRGVPASAVADLLDNFLVHPLNFDFQGDSIAAFLREPGGERDPVFADWTVALPTRGKALELDGRPAVVRLPELLDTSIVAGRRKVKVSDNGSLLVSGKSSRVGGRSDLHHAFTLDELRTATAGGAKKEEDELRSIMKAPLLVIYLLRGYESVGAAPEATERPYRDGLVLPALGLHFAGAQDPDAPRNLVRYRLNRVAQNELLQPDSNDDESGDDDDTDD